MQEPERASHRAVCSMVSCSNKTEVKTSAFCNSWDLTVSQMSLEGKQRCVIRKMSLRQGASAPSAAQPHALGCLPPSCSLSTYTVSLPEPEVSGATQAALGAGRGQTWQEEVWRGCPSSGAFFRLLEWRKVHSEGKAGGGPARQKASGPLRGRSGKVLAHQWPWVTCGTHKEALSPWF